MAKRLWFPVVIGFVLLYLILRPVANLLLHTLQVSATAYYAVIWPLVAAALPVMAHLVVRTYGMNRARSLLAVVVAALLSCALVAVLAWSTVTFAPDVLWLYSEPASLGIMALFSTATTLISLAVGSLSARRQSVAAADRAQSG